jgi:hypothetical protein
MYELEIEEVGPIWRSLILEVGWVEAHRQAMAMSRGMLRCPFH